MNNYIYILVSFFLTGLVKGNLNAQENLGLPMIQNHVKDAYQAGTQNWQVQQDKEGVIYFANNEGVLVFDGNNWRCFPVANKTIVRSILLDKDKIYVGSQGDFGYFKPNKKGILTYYSLLNLIPKKYRNFADVWNIITLNGRIYFRTTSTIFVYENDTIEPVISDDSFEHIGVVNGAVYVQSRENGLIKLTSKGKIILPNTEELKEGVISSILPFDENAILIFTFKKGVFKYDGETLEEWAIDYHEVLKKARITCAITLNNQQSAIGTMSGGLFIISKEGNILSQLNIEKGLQSNDILDVFRDGLGNLWLGLSNGVDYVETSSPFRTIQPDGNLKGSGYAVKVFKDKAYFGTSNGLFVTNIASRNKQFEAIPFELVSGTNGQVWNLYEFKDELLLGHHEGTFRIEDNRAINLSRLPGTWTALQPNGKPNVLIEGNYQGLNRYEFRNGHWQYTQKIDSMIEESCRIMAQDKSDNIWVAHPYRGVYKIILNKEKTKVLSTKLYNSKQGFPSDLYIYVFRIGESVVFSGETGIYQYNEDKDLFELSPSWSELISPQSRVQHLTEDKTGNIWFVVDDEVGVFWIDDLGVEKRLEKQTFPQLSGKLVGGFEQLYPYDKENVFFPIEKGFIQFNPTNYHANDSLFFAHIQSVKLGDTSIVFGGWRLEPSKEEVVPEFEHFENNFTFYYAATEYSGLSTVEFQYKLEGLEDDWSPWTLKTLKEYTSLRSNTYTFKLRARNAQGQMTQVTNYTFEIASPWYSSSFAKLIYLALLAVFLISLVVIPKKRYEQEKENLQQAQAETLQQQEQAYQKVVEKNEAEIIRLEQEKLASEIQFKNQELATTTMHLVQKGVLLQKLRSELEQVTKKTAEPATRKSVKSIIKLLNQDERLDEDWSQFSKYFDQVHEDFLKRLRDKFPQLTPKDQRLCTYLRMNLSTKEIAPLMNISVRGVEVGRYRLRKKIELETDANLNDIMMRL